MGGAGEDSAEGPGLEWHGEAEFSLDGTQYRCETFGGGFPSTSERLCIRKSRHDVTRLDRLLRDLAPQRIFELGIYEGGSAALISQIASEAKLVAIDIATEPATGLDEFIRSRSLQDSLVPHWGVDQADGAELRRIVDDEFAGRQLDLVVDDASHLLEQTRASFNTLFPLLRPGGSYLIEDWSWAHAPIMIWPKRPPLTILVFELVMACATTPGAIAGIEVDRAWTRLIRGEARFEPGEFDLAGLYNERGDELIAGLTPPRSRPQRRRRRWLRRPGDPGAS